MTGLGALACHSTRTRFRSSSGAAALRTARQLSTATGPSSGLAVPLMPRQQSTVTNPMPASAGQLLPAHQPSTATGPSSGLSGQQMHQLKPETNTRGSGPSPSYIFGREERRAEQRPMISSCAFGSKSQRAARRLQELQGLRPPAPPRSTQSLLLSMNRTASTQVFRTHCPGKGRRGSRRRREHASCCSLPSMLRTGPTMSTPGRCQPCTRQPSRPRPRRRGHGSRGSSARGLRWPRHT
jgi:hypothetical protein